MVLAGPSAVMFATTTAIVAELAIAGDLVAGEISLAARVQSAVI